MLNALEQQLMQNLIDKKVAVAKFLRMNWSVKKYTHSGVASGYTSTTNLVITAEGARHSTSRIVKVSITRHGGCYEVKSFFVTVPADLAIAVERGLSEALTKELRAYTLTEMLSAR
jgi:hypothetical protein